MGNEEAAEKKELCSAHVSDAGRDNASSTNPKTLVDYIEDARIPAGDKPFRA